MKREKFNKDWQVCKPEGGILGNHIMGFPEGKKIDLPHDAMIEEERNPECKNNTRTGFYPGGYYRYTKRFMAPLEWADKTITVEFEGSYMNNMVYLNGDYVGECKSGYTNFYVNLDQAILPGEENELEVLVNNLAEPNSRWYSGSGIYRDVNLIVGNLLHIKVDSTKIMTPEIEEGTAVIVLETKLENLENKNHRITVLTEIFDAEGKLVVSEEHPQTVYAGSTGSVRQRITLNNPILWECENPYLYQCVLTLKEGAEILDTEVHSFGIRKLQLDVVHGLRINGKEVKLRGACIHHDNGVIGARTFKNAEERRIRILKEAGFNCIRSAHHPAGKTLLEVCDRLGMLVMDELTDMWNHPKEFHDHAFGFEQNWKMDVERMVAKDFNHPCVILYSTGNEIQEVGTPKGAEKNREISDKFHELDPYRYTTNGYNGLLASIDYKKELSRAIHEKGEREQKGLNDIMGDVNDITSGAFLEQSYKHSIMSERIDDFMETLDVAGFNYMMVRHEMDRFRKPNRLVLGTETFPKEIAKLWPLVKKYPYLIGDMTWTGYDYLGEAALGKITYENQPAPEEKDRIASSGDISILGIRQTVSYYREIAFGLRKEPYLAVERPQFYGMQQNKGGWSFEDSLSSWTWRGFEGKPVIVDVYADAEEVELLINGASRGRKEIGREQEFAAKFEVIYEPGKVEAVSYKNGEVIGRYQVETADEEVQLCVQTDTLEIDAETQDVAYITVALKDASGRLNQQKIREISVSVEGAGYLLGYGNADPVMKGSYQDTTHRTYDGYVQAVVRSDGTKGEIAVTFRTEGCEEQKITIYSK